MWWETDEGHYTRGNEWWPLYLGFQIKGKQEWFPQPDTDTTVESVILGLAECGKDIKVTILSQRQPHIKMQCEIAYIFSKTFFVFPLKKWPMVNDQWWNMSFCIYFAKIGKTRGCSIPGFSESTPTPNSHHRAYLSKLVQFSGGDITFKRAFYQCC